MDDAKADLSDGGLDEDLDRALRAALGGDSEPEGPLAALERRTGSRAWVSLREDPSPRDPVPCTSVRVARRYVIADELGRGGVGVVLRGRDEDLGREVALKFLRPERLEEPAHVHRFLREARIEGQLQHPGIVPVYELGVSLDGRPFFAMKLVRGRDLSALLAARSSPEEDRRRFLGIFEQVCHAMAYAHARGVVHRDLKPANVMIGRFGEVQIVDWGFAKVLGARADDPVPPGPAAAGLAEAGASDAGVGDVLRTREGSMLGTPPYMPPEQAGRGVGPVDERADVFALGAILLEILTGSPAYRGETAEVLRQVVSGDLSDAHARLASCRADEALVALCRECLSPDPSGRPRDAGVVSTRLAQHLTSVEERAHRAELAAAEAHARAEGERRARRLTIALAASVLVAAFLGGGAWTWVTREREAQVGQAARDVARLVGEGREMLAAARRAPVGDLAPWDAARVTARSAEARAAAAREPDREAAGDLLRRVEEGRTDALSRKAAAELDLATTRRLEEIRGRRGGISDLREADGAYAAVFRARGIDPVEAGRAARAIEGTGIVGELVAALDDWAWVRSVLAGPEDPFVVGLRRTASAADPDAGRVAVRDAADGPALAALRAPGAAPRTPDAERLLGRRLSIAGDAPGAVEVLRSSWERDPSDFWTAFELAEALTALPQPAWGEAVAYYRAARAADPESRSARMRLAVALREAGRLDEAAEAWRAELRHDPSDPAPWRQLLDLHQERGDLPAEIAALEADLRSEPADAAARVGLGLALLLRREWSRAVTHLEEAVRGDGESPVLRTHLAEALLWAGRVDDAKTQIREAVRADARFAPAWEMLHRIHLVANENDEALAAIEEAARLAPDVPIHLFGLASALRFAGRLDEAIAVCDRFVAMCPFEPLAHQVRGFVLLTRRDLEEGAAEMETSIRLVRRGLDAAPWGITQVGAWDPETKSYRYHCVPGWDPNLGPSRAALANARLDLGDPDGALAALDVLPWDVPMRKMLAWTRQRILMVEGREDEALPLLEELSEDPAVTGEIRWNLGMLLLARGDAGRAREALLSYPALAEWKAGWVYPREDWARDVESLVRLGLSLRGGQSPGDLARDEREGVLLGLLLHAHGRQHAAMQVFDATFTAAPASAGRMLAWPVPYPASSGAAQTALLAGWGLGRDAHDLTPAERASCRKLALEWMRSALATLRRLAQEEPAYGPEWLKATSRSWLSQGGYALVREESNLRRLPEEEARSWREFWGQVRDEAD